MLVDTSVWVDHLRRGNAGLATALEELRVWAHPVVIGELACRHLEHRAELLRLLETLPQPPQATHSEALAFLEGHRLIGQGLGWIDVHLLASAALAGTALWTLDERLASTARRLGLGTP